MEIEDATENHYITNQVKLANRKFSINCLSEAVHSIFHLEGCAKDTLDGGRQKITKLWTVAAVQPHYILSVYIVQSRLF